MKDLGLPVLAASPPDGVEPLPEKNEPPVEYALRAAAAKALALKERLTDPPLVPSGRTQKFSSQITGASAHFPSNALIVAADTVVVLNGKIFGKPSGPEQALEFLRLLSGNTHEVFTACAIEGREISERFFARSAVTMWDCPDEILQAYSQREEPLDKAGGYAVQGEGSFLIDSIQGSWSNVVGLPLAELVRVLIKVNAIFIE